jgi:methylmalonyl-CoA mutase C-terminal domain/subunit
VVVGGIVPDNEEKLLLDAGVAEVMHPGCSLADVTSHIREHARAARAARATS